MTIWYFVFLLCLSYRIKSYSTVFFKTKSADPKYVNGVIAGHHLDLHQNYKAVGMKITIFTDSTIESW